MLHRITETERRKYEDIWAIDDYHAHSPGEEFVGMFLNMAVPKRGQSVIDIGCGSGAGTKALRNNGLIASGFDLTDTAWSHDDIPIHTGCIWQGLPRGPYDYGYCCDVMEHIPTQFVALSIQRILEVTPRAFFSVCFLEDNHGRLVGQPLHLTVQPFVWWRDTMRELGNLLEARDLQGNGAFYLGTR